MIHRRPAPEIPGSRILALRWTDRSFLSLHEIGGFYVVTVSCPEHVAHAWTSESYLAAEERFAETHLHQYRGGPSA